MFKYAAKHPWLTVAVIAGAAGIAYALWPKGESPRQVMGIGSSATVNGTPVYLSRDADGADLALSSFT